MTVAKARTCTDTSVTSVLSSLNYLDINWSPSYGVFTNGSEFRTPRRDIKLAPPRIEILSKPHISATCRLEAKGH